ncbi:hypothetical protein BH23BAC4_BH23BAC4_13690 [soil metagenome]
MTRDASLLVIRGRLQMTDPLSVLIVARLHPEVGNIADALHQAGFQADVHVLQTDDDWELKLASSAWTLVVLPERGEVPLPTALDHVRRHRSHPAAIVLAEPVASGGLSVESEGRLRSYGIGVARTDEVRKFGLVAAKSIQRRQQRMGAATGANAHTDGPAPTLTSDVQDDMQPDHNAVSIQPTGEAVEQRLVVRDGTAELDEKERGSFDTQNIYGDLADHLPIGIYRSTPEGRILYANPALPAVLGCETVEELLALDVKSDLGYPREHFAELMRSHGEVRNLEYAWGLRDGRTVYTRENARAVQDESGKVLYYEGTMEDVTTERVAQDRDKRRARQMAAILTFATAIDSANSIEAIYDAAVEAVRATFATKHVVLLQGVGTDAKFVAWTDALSQKDLDKCARQSIWETANAYAQPVFLRDLDGRGGKAVPHVLREVMELRGHRSMGSFPLLHRGQPLGMFVVFFSKPHTFDEQERQAAETLAWHIAGAVARFRAEHDLHKSEASLHFIAEHTGQVLYRRRYDTGDFDYLSPAVEELTGYSVSELEQIGGLASLVEHRHVAEGAGLMENPDPASAEGSARYVALYKMRTKGGNLRWVENNAYGWCDESGEAVGLVGVLTDVTGRKDAEERSRQQTERSLAHQKALVQLYSFSGKPGEVVQHFTAVAAKSLQCARVSFWMEDEENDVVACRGKYDTVLNSDYPDTYPLSAVTPLYRRLESERVLTISNAKCDFDPELEACLGVAREHMKAHGIGALLCAPVRRQGRVVGSVSFEHVGEGREWTTYEQDFAAAVADLAAVTLEQFERVKAEESLRQGELRYRAISDLAADYAYALRIDGDNPCKMAWATDALERISGFKPNEIAEGRGLLGLAHHEDSANVKHATELLALGEEIDLEFRIVTKNGQIRWVAHRARAHNEDGSLLIFNSGQDVTDRKAFESALVCAREEAEQARVEAEVARVEAEVARLEAEQAQEQAEEMARLKSAFLANMSHEIRTPLTGILGFASLLAEEVSNEHLEFVSLIEKSGKRLLETLNSVLDLARLEAGGLDVQPERVDVVSEARLGAQILSPLAERKGLSLSVIGPEESLFAMLDRNALTRIIYNLVGNAIKFTSDGSVALTIDRIDRYVRIQVKDTGIGIAEEFLPHVFDEFKQESTGRERSHEGSGLGLAITKKLVMLMKGQIEIQSEKGVGSTFTITFPLCEENGSLDRDGFSVHRPVVAAKQQQPQHPAQRASLLFEDMPLTPIEAPDTLPEDRLKTTGSETEIAPRQVLNDERSQRKWMFPAPTDDLPVNPPVADQDIEKAAVNDSPEAFPTAEFRPLAETPNALPEQSEEVGKPDSPEDKQPSPDVPSWLPPAYGNAGGDSGDGGVTEEPFWSAPVVEPEPYQSDEASQDTSAEAAVDEVKPPLLVVEDNPDTRRLLERILQGHYEVTAVADARVALGMMSQNRYTALVLDINLGGKQTGMDILRVARTLPGYAGVHAIALTAYALPGDRERFMKAGFDDYVPKPFTRASLLEALEPALAVERALM